MSNYGTITHNGKAFTVAKAPYPTGDIRAANGEIPMYWEAPASDADGNCYKIHWEERAEGERDMYDDSDACDWVLVRVIAL